MPPPAPPPFLLLNFPRLKSKFNDKVSSRATTTDTARIQNDTDKKQVSMLEKRTDV